MGLTPSPDGRRGSVLFSLWLLSLAVFLLPPIWALIAIVPAGRAARRLVRVCARGVLLLSGCPLHVSGLEHLRGEPCVVIVANHSSYLDVVVLLAAIPHDYRFVANHLAGTRPLVGMVIRKEGHLLVDRGSAPSRVDSARRMARTLEEGTSLLVFPEGTRSAGTLGRFTSGAFRAAMRTGRPIVPIAIAGTGQILPRRALLGRPSAIEVTVLRPIPTGTATRANAVDLRVAAAHAITAALYQPRLVISGRIKTHRMSEAPTRTGASAGVDASSGVPWSFESPSEHWRCHDAREVAYWRSRPPEERLAQAAHYRERVHGAPPWPTRWTWAFVEPHR